MAGRVRVPVAVRQHTRVRRHVEEARHGLRKPRERPRLRPGVHRLHVAVAVERPVVGGLESHAWGSLVFSLTR